MVTAARTTRPKLTIVKQTSIAPTVKHSTNATPKLKTTARRSLSPTHPVWGARSAPRTTR